MSYHGTSSTSTTSTTSTTTAARSATNVQGQAAPVGYHYMPNGVLMADSAHGGYKSDKVIKSINLNTANVKASGEVRELVVRGDNGAKFNLEIKDGDNVQYYNFETNLFQTTPTKLQNASITGGAYSKSIVFPSAAAGVQYDFYFITNEGTKHSKYNEFRLADGSVDINSTTGSNSNIIRKVIYQTLDVDLTITGFSPNAFVSGTSTNATISVSRGGSLGQIPFEYLLATGSTNTLVVDKQPSGNDLMAFMTPTIGGPVNIPGEDIYPQITAADKVVNGASSGIAVTMDDDFTGLWAVGDRITGNAALDARTQATAVTVAAINVEGNAKVFQMSEAIAINDDETLSFSNQRNYRWTISSTTEDVSKITPGMQQVPGGFFDGTATISDYVEHGSLVEEKYIAKVKVPGIQTLGIKPIVVINTTTKVATTTVGNTSTPINITFDKQALKVFSAVTTKIFAYGTNEIYRLTGWDIEISDLIATASITATTTTAAVNSSTSVPITQRAGITDLVSSVSGVGINPGDDAPTVASGAGAVSGAGTIVLSAAQTLENGIKLTFPGASKRVTINGKIKINHVGNEDLTLRFDWERFLTMH